MSSIHDPVTPIIKAVRLACGTPPIMGMLVYNDACIEAGEFEIEYVNYRDGTLKFVGNVFTGYKASKYRAVHRNDKRPGGRTYDSILDRALSASCVEVADRLVDDVDPKAREEAKGYFTERYSDKPFYMCHIDGTVGPRVRHDSYEKACAEAERLASMLTNRGKNVYVLCSIQKANKPKPRTCEAWVNVYDHDGKLEFGQYTWSKEQTTEHELIPGCKFLTCVKINYTEK